MISEVYNCDCYEYMKSLPDKYFDLCIADPPYVALEENTGTIRTTGNVQSSLALGGKPSDEVFQEMFRVSKHQIIWGANNFGYPFQGFVVWEKTNIPDDFTMSRCEVASLDKGLSRVSKMIRMSSAAHKGHKRIHPCLPSGERVYFNNKWMNIENVKIGDKNDYGTVIATTTHTAEKMVEIEVGGSKTISTYNHPFLILRGTEIAWCEAEQITNNDYILWNENLPQRDILDTNTKADYALNTTLCGNNITETYQVESKSTTLMEIKQIIELRTLCLSLPLNTNGYTVVARLSMENGINRVLYAENTSLAQKNIGIFQGDGLMGGNARNAIHNTLCKSVKCSLRKVGNVKITLKNKKVYNLTIDGSPVFDTAIGISHNTEKPIALYAWLLDRYAQKGWKIFDPFLGSGSSRIAAYKKGFDFYGCELDEEYYKAQEERFRRECFGEIRQSDGKKVTQLGFDF